MASKFILGIRREDKNPWERRTPLIPVHARELIRDLGIEIWAQPSEIRVFRDEDYAREGVKIREDLSPCSVVLGVKEMPSHFFRDHGVYVFFSHTIKGQAHNMPMLRTMIERRATLIDYERIVDERGRRLVFFGRQAGQAGMIDTLWALGRRLEREGLKTPFSSIRQTVEYVSLVEALEAVRSAGAKIQQNGLPASLVPCVFGFAGYGHVSAGAQEVFDLLPHVEIPPREIGTFFQNYGGRNDRVYKTVFKEEDMVRPIDPTRDFSLQDYYDHPENYRPVLEDYLPHLTVLVNAIYWTPRYPHFVTKNAMRRLYRAASTPRFRVVGDLSCDIAGAVEFTLRTTTPADPVFTYDVASDRATEEDSGRGPLVLAVDNLPAEISLESSVYFSQVLKDFIPALAAADFSADYTGLRLPPPLLKAVILHRGELTPEYAYLRGYLNECQRSQE